jgi:hypothetical protein
MGRIEAAAPKNAGMNLLAQHVALKPAESSKYQD